ncbi:MAG: ribonuclease H-like domain-containing protein [Malacoplasma sp.]|nr:ribonuclease H-like domain-containing protein [Malacoplasma sp.]
MRKNAKNISFNFVPTDIVFNSDEKNFFNHECVILDIETTGLDAINDKIIQFGAVKYISNKMTGYIEFYVDPEIEIPEFITNINHIKNEDVKGQIKIKEGLERIKNFIGKNAFLIAHNGINFDLNFINSKLKENNMELINQPLLDTMWLSKAINPHFYKHSLANIVQEYAIDYDLSCAHQALYDVNLLLQVWNVMKNQLKEYDVKSLNDLNKKFVKYLGKKIDYSKIHC